MKKTESYKAQTTCPCQIANDKQQNQNSSPGLTKAPNPALIMT